MSDQYKVVPLRELVDPPPLLSRAKERIDAIATSLSEKLNAMYDEDWDLVTIYASPGEGFAVFKRRC